MLVFVTTTCVLAVPYLVRQAIDRGAVARDADVMVSYSLAIMALTVVGTLAQRKAISVCGSAIESTIRNLRVRVWSHLHSLSLDFFDSVPTPRAVSYGTQDVDALYDMVTAGSLAVLPNALLVAGLSLVIVSLDPPTGAVVLLVGCSALGVSRIFERRGAEAFRRQRSDNALVLERIEQTMTGVRVCRSLSAEKEFRRRFDAANSEYATSSGEAWKVTNSYGPSLAAHACVALFAVIMVGGGRVIAGALTLGSWMGCVLCVRQSFEPVQGLVQFHNAYRSGVAGLERICSFLQTVPSLPSARGTSWSAAGARGGEIVLEGVWFAYAERPVIKDVSLIVPGGSTMMIMGATGSGKSTVVKLMQRLLVPSKGNILLDGSDVSTIDVASLRKYVIGVSQEPYVFGGTVRENVTAGIDDVAEADFQEVARVVGLDDVVATLRGRFDASVGVGGVRLSAGQAQVVSIARALVRRPQILILDEATSSLDEESELAVLRGVRRYLAGATLVIISHRRRPLEISDFVAVLSDGSLKRSGSSRKLRSAADASPGWPANH